MPDQSVEFLIMGLRLREGVDLHRYAALAGHPLDQEKLSDLVALGMVTEANDKLVVSDQGFSVLNAILRQLLDA
ncbi:MAG: hypothetical protein AAFO77_11535 [Pseudomonadota bacterium]